MVSDASDLDRVRRNVLDFAEQSQRRWKQGIVLFGVLEVVGWGIYIGFALAGFSLPVLIGVAAALVYGTLAAGLLMLGIHVDYGMQRLMKSIECLAETGRHSTDTEVT